MISSWQLCFRSYSTKHWKNGKSDAVLREFRSITTLLDYVYTKFDGIDFDIVNLQQCQDGGNATEIDAVFRGHQVKYWKKTEIRGSNYNMEMTAEIIKIGI